MFFLPYYKEFIFKFIVTIFSLPCVSAPYTELPRFSPLKKPSYAPASFFEREAKVFFVALKTKSCLSEASSFCLAQKSTGVVQKMQPANFIRIQSSSTRLLVRFLLFGQKKMNEYSIFIITP